MYISVSDAKDRLAELVARAEAGESVLLTVDGREVAVIRSVAHSTAENERTFAFTPEERFARIAAIAEASSRDFLSGPSAARSQDFLYDDAGLPS